MKSMTGFGRAVAERDGERVSVTVQSWNHRHLDLVFRLPEELRPFESELRERVVAHVLRGRCEVGVRIDSRGEETRSKTLDIAAIEKFLGEVRPLIEQGVVAPGLRVGELMRSPFLVAGVDDNGRSEVVLGAVLDALDQALLQHAATRRAEGEKISRALEAAWRQLGEVVETLAVRREEIGSSVEEGLRARLDEILPEGARPLPPERLAQEIALLAERSDVREELDRLHAHLDHFQEQRTGVGPHGRRLEFLTQELLRELNTIGSKSRDIETTRLVMAGKVLNEQLREQVQNAE